MSKRIKLWHQASIETLESRQLLSASVQQVADFGASYTSFDTVANGKAYLKNNGEFTESLSDFYSTDGTAAGTKEYLAAVAVDSVVGLVSGNALVFVPSATSGTDDVYVTDGTAAGTKALSLSGVHFANERLTPVAFGGDTLAIIRLSNNNSALYRINGTASQVTNLGTFAQAGSSNLTNSGSDIAILNSKAYFVVGNESSFSLMQTDGTAAGTTAVFTQSEESDESFNVVAVNGKIYWTVENDFDNGTQLWASDGTAAGTKKVATYANWASTTTVAGTRIFFTSDPDNVADGDVPPVYYFDTATSKSGTISGITVAGAEEGDAVSVKTAGAIGSVPIFYATAFDGQTSFFSVAAGKTAATRLKDVNGHDDGIVYNGAAYFEAATTGSGVPTALYQSDGTASGTVELPFAFSDIDLKNSAVTSKGLLFAAEGADQSITDAQQLWLLTNAAVSTLPTVSITATDATATEGTPTKDTGTYTVTRTGSTTAALTVNLTISGTATNGKDYTTIPATVTIAKGKTSATITLSPTDDTTVESTETAIFTLASSSAYTIDSANKSATVSILDNDSAVTTLPSVSIVAKDSAADESGSNPGTFTFTRAGDTSVALTVTVTIAGTATNGTDYKKIGASVTFAKGSTTATITITPTADKKVEGTETVVLTIVTSNLYKINSSKSTATINIADTST